MKLMNSLVSLVAVLLIFVMGPAPGATTDHGWSGKADHPGYAINNSSAQVQHPATFIGVDNTAIPNAVTSEAAQLDLLATEVQTHEVSTRVVSFDSMDRLGTVNTKRWCGYADSNAPSVMRV